jgi:hypothetical protein
MSPGPPTSNQIDQLPLSLAITLDVSLGSSEVRVPSKLLNIPQATPDFDNSPGSPCNKGPTTAMAGAANKTQVGI